MSAPNIIYWPSSTGNEDAICVSQDVALNDQFIIKSNTPNQIGVFTFDKLIRHVSFTSDDANVGVNLRIQGIGSPVDDDGNPTQTLDAITEDISAPGSETVESENIFSRIDSITVISGNATSVSVGFGSGGITDYVFLNTECQQFQASVSAQFRVKNTATVTFYKSLNKPYTPNESGGVDKFEPIPAFVVQKYPDGVFEDVTDNTLGFIEFPVVVTWANIQDTASDSIVLTTIQQWV